MGGSVPDWSLSRLLPLSCKSFKRLSFRLSPPPSVSSLIAVDLSLEELWCCQTRQPPWPPGPSIIEPWAVQQPVCVRNPVVYFRYKDWQPDLIRLSCWIKTCFSCCCDHGCQFSAYCVLRCGIKLFRRVVLMQRAADTPVCLHWPCSCTCHLLQYNMLLVQKAAMMRFSSGFQWFLGMWSLKLVLIVKVSFYLGLYLAPIKKAQAK